MTETETAPEWKVEITNLQAQLTKQIEALSSQIATMAFSQVDIQRNLSTLQTNSQNMGQYLNQVTLQLHTRLEKLEPKVEEQKTPANLELVKGSCENGSSCCKETGNACA